MHGVQSPSKGDPPSPTRSSAPLYPLLRALFPKSVTNTEELGRAMIRAARGEAPKKILEPADLIALGSVPNS